MKRRIESESNVAQIYEGAKINQAMWFTAIAILDKEHRTKEEDELVEDYELVLELGIQGTFYIEKMKRAKEEVCVGVLKNLDNDCHYNVVYLNPRVREGDVFKGSIHPMLLAHTSYFFSPLPCALYGKFESYRKAVKEYFRREYQIYTKMFTLVGVPFPTMPNKKTALQFLKESNIPGKEIFKDIITEVLPKTSQRPITLIPSSVGEPYILSDFEDLLKVLHNLQGKQKNYTKPFLVEGYFKEPLLYFLLTVYQKKIVDIFSQQYKKIRTFDDLMDYLADKKRVSYFDYAIAEEALTEELERG